MKYSHATNYALHIMLYLVALPAGNRDKRKAPTSASNLPLSLRKYHILPNVLTLVVARCAKI